ncbi:MAG: class I SAM-dependent methyltransferase [Chloroflexales bacterium]|nr:class I SAM-dependent methyltransferase [Chloroflexales bacterium]
MHIDFGLTARDYATHRAGFPDTFFERLAALGIGLPNDVIVDLGTGTGTLARGFAKRGCYVTGIDVAAPLIEEAQQLDNEAKVAVTYRVAPAENTGLPSSVADVATAGQCWHWFDRSRAAAEVARLLRPGGHGVIAHFDWIPLHGNVVEATERLVERYNPAWRMGGGSGIYPLWLRDLAEAGFEQIKTFSYDVHVPYAPMAWRGRLRASAGIGASLSPEQVQEFDADLATLLQSQFPADVLSIHHRVWAVIAQRPQ